MDLKPIQNDIIFIEQIIQHMNHKIFITYATFQSKFIQTNYQPSQIQDLVIWIFLNRFQLVIEEFALQIQERQGNMWGILIY